MVMAAPGKGESSTDNVYSGLCLVAENGEILSQDEREDSLAISELDIEYLMNLRRAGGEFDLGRKGGSHPADPQLPQAPPSPHRQSKAAGILPPYAGYPGLRPCKAHGVCRS